MFLDHDCAVSVSSAFEAFADNRPLRSVSGIGLSAIFPELGFPVTLSAAQNLQFNPDGDTDDPDTYFLNSSGSVSGEIPTGFSHPRLGAISYNPSVSLSKSWRFDGPVQDEDRLGLLLSIAHSIAFSRVDWIENMRAGGKGAIVNTNAFNLETRAMTLDTSLYLALFGTTGGRIGYVGQVKGFYRFMGDEAEDLGDSMRGIIDDRLLGDADLFLNLSLPVKLFDFPTHLLIKKNWLDFELQASPFFDMGMVRRKGEWTLTADNLWYSGGLEFFVFPVIMRSFIIRASLGFDLQSVISNESLTAASPRDGRSPYEIYFGLGLFL